MSCFQSTNINSRTAVLLFRHIRGYLSIEGELWGKQKTMKGGKDK